MTLQSSLLRFFLRCVVSVALIALVARKVNWIGLGTVLRGVDARWAVGGSLCTLLLIGALATRWRMFLRQQTIDVRYGTIFSLTWAGQFFNSVLPGSTGGDVVKIYQLCRLVPDRKAAAAATVFADRVSALMALLLLAGGAFVLAPVPLQSLAPWAGSMQAIALWGFAGLVALTAVGWLVFRFLRGTRWLGRVQRTLAASAKSLELNRNLLGAVLLSFGIHLLNFLIIFLFARSLGVAISYMQILLIMPVVLLLVMIPVTVNGHGLREVLLIYFFTHFHITLGAYSSVGVKETVIALSVLLVANDLLWSLPGGLWYFTRFKGLSVSQ